MSTKFNPWEADVQERKASQAAMDAKIAMMRPPARPFIPEEAFLDEGDEDEDDSEEEEEQ